MSREDCATQLGETAAPDAALPISIDHLQDVPATLLIPLWARAVDACVPRPLLNDPHAGAICARLDFDFEKFRGAWKSRIGCCCRAAIFDIWTREFLTEHPDGAIFEIGVGLDTRFERLDNGRARWFQLDLPPVIALRRRLLAPSPRRAHLAGSLLDDGWLRELRRSGNAPVLFIAEGILEYFEPAQVRAFIERLGRVFPRGTLAFDALAPFMVRWQRFHDTLCHFAARFRWGMRDLDEFARWLPAARVTGVYRAYELPRPLHQRLPLPVRLLGRMLRALPGMRNACLFARLEWGAPI